jgi:hypothetical protein
MSLEIGEGEKCYRFLDGGVHCWHWPIAAFRDGHYQPKADIRVGVFNRVECFA